MTEAPHMGSLHHLDDHRAAKDAATALPVSLVKSADSPANVPAESSPAGEAVDRPDNPLADWLTVPDTPVLPVWARSRASVLANVTALGRLTWWHTRFHGIRTPST